MSNYRFNQQLLKALPDVLNLHIPQICHRCGIAVGTFRRWRDDGKMPVNALMKLCNGMKIPAMHFIATDMETVIGKEDDYVFLGRQFHEIGFDLAKLRKDLTENIGMNYTQISAFLEVSQPTSNNWLNKEKDGMPTLQVEQFLLICNKFKLYPGSYLIDANMQLPMLPLFRKNCLQISIEEYVKNHKRWAEQMKHIIEEIERRQRYGIPIDEDEIIRMACEG